MQSKTKANVFYLEDIDKKYATMLYKSMDGSSSDYSEEGELKAVESMTQMLRKHNVKPERGDLVSCIRKGFRNDGYAIYDGEKCVPLASEPDDYGSIPHSFPVMSEFSFNWFDSLPRCNFVPVKHANIRDNLLNNIVVNTSDDFEPSILSILELDGHTYRFYYPFGETIKDVENLTNYLNNNKFGYYLKGGALEDYTDHIENALLLCIE
jgi:hypothetical protein